MAGWTLTSEEDRVSWNQKARDRKPLAVVQEKNDALELTGRAYSYYCNEQLQLHGPHVTFKGWKDFSEEEKNHYLATVQTQ